MYSVSGPERIIYLQLTIDLCQVLGGAFRQESMPGGVGIHEGLGETGWIVAKDMDEYMETFNRLEISGGKVTGWQLISYHETWDIEIFHIREVCQGGDAEVPAPQQGPRQDLAPGWHWWWVLTMRPSYWSISESSLLLLAEIYRWWDVGQWGVCPGHAPHQVGSFTFYWFSCYMYQSGSRLRDMTFLTIFLLTSYHPARRTMISLCRW